MTGATAHKEAAEYLHNTLKGTLTCSSHSGTVLYESEGICISVTDTVSYVLIFLCSSGWKRDHSGNWIQDEEVEFDSDEEIPLDFPV